MSFINQSFTLNSNFLRSEYLWLLLNSSAPGTKHTYNHKYHHIKYILDGSVTHSLAGREIKLYKGNAFLIKPNTPYNIHTVEGYRMLDIIVSGREPKTAVFQEFLKYTSEGFAVTGRLNLNLLYEDLRRIMTVPSDINLISIQNKSEGMVLSVLEELARTVKSDFRSIIESINIAENVKFDLKMLCELTSYSQTHFERLMLKNFGCSGIEYFNRIRVNKICELLRTTRLPLSQIAEKTGFYDTSHLTYFFKKRMGITPGKYRKNQF